MKKKVTLYVDEKWINKLGGENKSKIIEAALARYFNDEKQNYKNDLQIIRDFDQSINNLNNNLKNEIEIIKEQIRIVFNMAGLSANLVDIVRLAAGEKKEILDNINLFQNQFKELINKEKKS